MKYRERQAHDGVVPLDVRERVYLPDGFDRQNQPTGFNKEPARLCKQHFKAIEGLIDQAYQMMWDDDIEYNVITDWPDWVKED